MRAGDRVHPTPPNVCPDSWLLWNSGTPGPQLTQSWGLIFAANWFGETTQLPFLVFPLFLHLGTQDSLSQSTLTNRNGNPSTGWVPCLHSAQLPWLTCLHIRDLFAVLNLESGSISWNGMVVGQRPSSDLPGTWAPEYTSLLLLLHLILSEETSGEGPRFPHKCTAQPRSAVTPGWAWHTCCVCVALQFLLLVPCTSPQGCTCTHTHTAMGRIRETEMGPLHSQWVDMCPKLGKLQGSSEHSPEPPQCLSHGLACFSSGDYSSPLARICLTSSLSSFWWSG